jgi:RNA polymerase sigma factor for flagellar operon FliA
MQAIENHSSDSGTHLREAALLEQIPQVRFIARKIHERLPQHIDLEDLVHAGILGLLDAMEKYDGSRNVQFKSYAQFRIRGAILDNLRELDWGPRHLRKQARRIEEARLALAAQSGRAPSEEELAFAVGLSLNKFQLLVGELRGLDLLSIQVDNPDETYQEDLDLNLADPNCEDPFDACSKSEIQRLVRNALIELPRREGQILVLYYFEELTMKQIGTLLGVVESRISQMHASVMQRLRNRLGATCGLPLRRKRKRLPSIPAPFPRMDTGLQEQAAL